MAVQAFERLDVVPAYKVVCDAIEREIVNERLLPGQPLPTETELAAQFGVNRSTVREGIRLLEQSGLVRREAGRRLFVSLPHYGELAPRSSRALVMQKVTFRELWEVTMELEQTAADYAAQRISGEILERLEQNLEGTRKAAARGESIVPWDVEFHALIAEATGNRVLLLAREPLSLLFYPTLTKLFVVPGAGERAQDRLIHAHACILEALKRNDATVAREWMRKHIVDFKRGYDLCGFNLDARVEMPTMPTKAGAAA